MLKFLVGMFKKKEATDPPRVVFCSDNHYSHKNVLLYCNRPFANVDEMNEAMVKSWNEQVRPQDTVYCLGDFSMNPKKSRQFAPRLNGRKVLIPGNHDACFPHEYNRKLGHMTKRYLEDGWVEIIVQKHITLKNGLRVLLSHLPYAPVTGDTNNYDVRYLEHRPVDDGRTILLHGHLHGRYVKHGRMIDVGYDAHAGKILTEDDVIALIEDPREFIPGPLTEFYKARLTQGGGGEVG